MDWRVQTLERRQAFAVLLSAALADLDVQSLDFLIEGGERDAKLFCGFRLIPITTFQFLNDDASFDHLEDIEERSVGIVFQQRILEAAAGNVPGQQVGADHGTR
jgi:hypothetical protein